MTENALETGSWNYLAVQTDNLLRALGAFPRARLVQQPTPLHELRNYGKRLGIDHLWIKRDDLTGLAGGGNKTRKLEFFVGEALEQGADMLVTAGAIQSNHTRQTAAAAAKHGLKCALLHFGWANDAGPTYRTAGNILLSSLMGADLYVDETARPIEDQSPLLDFSEKLRHTGHRPYMIPAGASEHRLGSFGYMVCAAELVDQWQRNEMQFDFIVHCTGSSSTQSGLLAGLKLLGCSTKVVGVADDDETSIKSDRVMALANNALQDLKSDVRVTEDDVEVIAVDQSVYGEADNQTLQAIRDLASSEGLIADPVYEGKALRGLHYLVNDGRFNQSSRVLLMHLGGTPAVHGYAEQLGRPRLTPISGE